MSKLRIVFMGTPDFAVESLKILVENKYEVVGVITMPDKPAGRGQQLQQSAVKKYAAEKGLFILQPEKLKAPDFLEQLRLLKADLQIVVAFRMLPEVVWSMPSLGTFNLHGSLLPQYRGAAPINWAVINGEKETGVSTFFLQQEIDTGKIIYREKTSIEEDASAGDIHDRLMVIGAALVLKTVQAIEKNDYPQIEQAVLIANGEEEKHAPKLFKEDCKINWNQSVIKIHNFIRGLSPYPTAFSTLLAPDKKEYAVKIFKTEKEITSHTIQIGSVVTDSKTFLKIAVQEGYIVLLDIQLSGKKRMPVADFLRGFPLTNEWSVI
jgi:methionyl-tRNA formyltransferase